MQIEPKSYYDSSFWDWILVGLQVPRHIIRRDWRCAGFAEIKTTWDEVFQARCLPQDDVFKGNFQQECNYKTGGEKPSIFTQVQQKPS